MKSSLKSLFLFSFFSLFIMGAKAENAITNLGFSSSYPEVAYQDGTKTKKKRGTKAEKRKFKAGSTVKGQRIKKGPRGGLYYTNKKGKKVYVKN